MLRVMILAAILFVAPLVIYSLVQRYRLSIEKPLAQKDAPVIALGAAGGVMALIAIATFALLSGDERGGEGYSPPQFHLDSEGRVVRDEADG
jgi:hypothetical protein